jgi:hypothetical protein
MLAITEHANEVRSAAQSGRRSCDAALIEAVAAGDRTAMQVLYARHHVRIYRFLLRLTNDASLADELVSDVFFVAWRGELRGQVGALDLDACHCPPQGVLGAQAPPA